MNIKNNQLSIIFSIILISFILTVPAFSYEEAPMLQEKVQKGDLPEVEERLPEEPLEIKPWHETGEYGGTWDRFSTSEEWIFFRMSQYGYSLLRWDGGEEIEPGLVKNWEFNDSSEILTLHFRKGIKWSDGEPFTAEDFMFWWEEMAANLDHPQPVPDWAMISGEQMEVEQIDDYTVKLKFAAPAPLVPYHLATYPNGGISSFDVVPAHYLKQFHPEYNDEYDNYEEFQEKQEWWINLESPVLAAWKPVEHEPGNFIKYKRNPYYYAVDTEGNQLPYIDKVNINYVSEREIFKLKLSKGQSDMQIRPGQLTMSDISLLKRNEEDNNFKTLLWDSSSATGALFYPNQNHPDSEKRKLYRNPKFLRALSHAINRDRIQRMIYYEEGTKTTGTTLAPSSVEGLKTDELKESYKELQNLAIEYDTDKAKSLLEDIGVVDQNDDGWRELPNGDELELRIDFDAEVSVDYINTIEMVSEFWEEIGLKTIENSMDGSQLIVMQQNANIDIRGGWEIGIGPHPMELIDNWLVPKSNERWAPLYGAWILAGSEAETESDKDPRDRAPARKKPSGIYKEMQNLYFEAISTEDPEKREKITAKIVDLHVENGPFVIGTVAGYPRIGVVKDNFKNVPTREELPMGGFINPWHMAYPASINPEQFYIEQ